MPKFIELVSLKEALNGLALTALDAENTQDAYMLRQAAQSVHGTLEEHILTISVGFSGEPIRRARGTHQVEVVRNPPLVRMIRVYSTGVAFEAIGCLTVYADLTRTDLTGGAPHYLIEEQDEQVFF
jgi:hypothetical protein